MNEIICIKSLHKDVCLRFGCIMKMVYLVTRSIAVSSKIWCYLDPKVCVMSTKTLKVFFFFFVVE